MDFFSTLRKIANDVATFAVGDGSVDPMNGESYYDESVNETAEEGRDNGSSPTP